jgi:hypothetical protein
MSSPRILFNWDGSDVIAMLGDDPTRQRFLDLVFGCLDGSQVDVLLYNLGCGNVAEYASDVLEWPGEADGFKFASDGGRRRYENAKALADAGHNPPKLVAEACRQRGLPVFVSMRMNDIHDAFLPYERPTFKRENPQWLLTELRDNSANLHLDDVPGLERYRHWPDYVRERRAATSLDYSLPQVRQQRLDIIREYFEKWDFDGIELDWSRHHNHFPPLTAFDRRQILTDFTRAVRDITENAATRLGHPVQVIARVSETLHGCTVGGYDVAAWLRDDLVDGLVLGDMAVSIPYLQQFRDVTPPGRHVPLYPSVYGYGNGYKQWDDAALRGVAACMWMRGADGLATYNLYPRGDYRRKVLTQIGDPGTLDGTSKRYLSPQRYLLAYSRISRHSCPAAPLPAYLNIPHLASQRPAVDHTVWCELDVADDVAALAGAARVDRIELVVGIERLHPEDRVFISFNGRSLTKDWGDDVGTHIETIHCNVDSDVDAPADTADKEAPYDGFRAKVDAHPPFEGVRFEPPAELIRKGMNCVQVLLLPGNHRPDDKSHDLDPILVTRVELYTRFRC